MPSKTQREREEAQRKAKLERIEEQVADGSLVIRQMTDEERARLSSPEKAKEAAEKPRRRRRSSGS
jgi:hypothetical protein